MSDSVFTSLDRNLADHALRELDSLRARLASVSSSAYGDLLGRATAHFIVRAHAVRIISSAKPSMRSFASTLTK